MSDDEIRVRLQQAVKSAEALVSVVEQRSHRLGQSGRRNFPFDRGFRMIVALLSVASPTLVAFQSQHQATSPVSWIVVTVLVAVAGASTTLQSNWQFGRIAVQETLNAMQLDQICARLNAAIGEANATTDKLKAFSDLNAKFDQLQTQYWSAMKGHFEGEAARIVEVGNAAPSAGGAVVPAKG